MPTWVWVFNLGINMNIELEEVAVQDVSDDALEMAAASGQGGQFMYLGVTNVTCWYMGC